MVSKVIIMLSCSIAGEATESIQDIEINMGGALREHVVIARTRQRQTAE